MKRYIFTTVMILIIYSQPSHALTHCSNVVINNIQVTDVNISVKANNVWHNIDAPSKPSIDRKLSILITAHASGKEVQLIFEADNYQCNTGVPGSRLYGIRLLD